MADSDAERASRYRQRRKGNLEIVPDEDPGPVADGLEVTLASLTAPDRALSAAARSLAAAIDRSGAAQPAAVAELRRVIGQMRRDEAALLGERPGLKAVSGLDRLRESYASRHKPGAARGTSG